MTNAVIDEYGYMLLIKKYASITKIQNKINYELPHHGSNVRYILHHSPIKNIHIYIKYLYLSYFIGLSWWNSVEVGLDNECRMLYR